MVIVTLMLTENFEIDTVQSLLFLVIIDYDIYNICRVECLTLPRFTTTTTPSHRSCNNKRKCTNREGREKNGRTHGFMRLWGVKGLGSETGSVCVCVCAGCTFTPEDVVVVTSLNQMQVRDAAEGSNQTPSNHMTPTHSNCSCGVFKDEALTPGFEESHVLVHTHINAAHTLIVYSVSHTASPPAALSRLITCFACERICCSTFLHLSEQEVRLWLSNDCLCGFCIVFNLKSDPGRDRNQSVSPKEEKRKRKTPSRRGGQRNEMLGRSAKSRPLDLSGERMRRSRRSDKSCQ